MKPHGLQLAVAPLDRDVSRGDRVTALGVLRVTAHPPAVVDGVRVPAWTEVRVR